MCISFQLTVHTDTGVQIEKSRRQSLFQSLRSIFSDQSKMHVARNLLMKTGVRGTLLVDKLLFDVLTLSLLLLRFVTRASSFIVIFLRTAN